MLGGIGLSVYELRSTDSEGLLGSAGISGGGDDKEMDDIMVIRGISYRNLKKVV